jgi:phosphoribosylanthranilate isomerase
MNNLPERVRVKICGVRTVEEAHAVAHAGADAIGINFYPPSPRYLPPAEAGKLLAALPAFVDALAVVVRPEPDFLRYLIEEVGFRTLQLHDGEPLADYPGVRYILAAGIADTADLLAVEERLTRWLERGVSVAAVLLDARVPGKYGGTGATPPWSIVARFSRRRPLILAGGLNPENVAAAIVQVRPFAVDVASGVETAPGIKDLAKVRAFLQAVRDASGSELR